MEIIEKETKGKSYHTYKYSYDSIGLPSIDYDDDPNKIMKWKDSGETGSPKKPIDLKPLADQLQSVGEKPLLKYFLDGSRHVFKVDDIAYNKQVFPVVAGQIGIGCCKRENKRMSKERFYRELVLALPDKANADGWDDAAYFAAKVKKLNESEELKRLGLHFSAIIPYSTSKAGSPDTKLDNLAVGVIQDYMIEAEKRMVAELVKDKRLGQDAYLLKDGSLEYKIMKSGREDLRTLQKIKHNYSWVIGVSKSFNPESCLDHTGKPNSNYIADLPVFHRTPVARYENREFLGDVQFGVWYIRLRDKRRTQTPFDGVVKVEKIMMDAIADSVTKGNKEYVATYRELTQTLNGIYGELLIDTARLSDNARRDWFRIDASSIQLRTILTDFLRKLKAYRYAASQAFNDKQTLAKKQKVIAAYEDLTNGFDSKKFEQEFYDTTEYPKEDNAFFYADDDIPRRSITTKKFYEEILTGLKEYFTSSYKEQGIEIFVKMRTFLKQYLNKQD